MHERGEAVKRAETTIRSPSCLSVTIRSLSVTLRVRRWMSTNASRHLDVPVHRHVLRGCLCFLAISTPSAAEMIVGSTWPP